ncbi:Ff.00g035920.m01.CDS01 [Fusarium sp. VM40]|nr:Ff.00g035920.m01.CDS01 [Fusarium sp. VM40]
MSPRVINLDKRADIQVVMGLDENKPDMILNCCSRALARSSTFIRCMLHEKSKNAGHEERINQVFIEWGQGDVLACTIFFNILHCNFHQIPRAINFETLHSLVVLAHRFEAPQMLTPWVESWITSIEIPSNFHPRSQCMMLETCWKLQLQDKFLHLAKQATMNFSKTDFNNMREMGLEIPLGTIECIRAIRYQIMGELLSMIQDLVTSYLEFDKKPCPCPKAQWLSAWKRKSKTLGSFITGLIKTNLWPLPDSHDVNDSISEFRQKITTFVVCELGQDLAELDQDDSLEGEGNLSFTLLDRIENIL